MSFRWQGLRRDMRAAIVSAALALSLAGGQAEAALEAYVLSGLSAPDGNGQLSTLRPPVLNDVGQMSFIATMTGTAGGPTASDRTGVLFRDSNGALTQIARGGQSAPGGGVLTDFGETTWLNDDGDVAFYQLGNVTGIFRGPPLVKIVRTGITETAPGGNGYFGTVRMGGMNDAGQASFRASLLSTSPSSSNRGIYRGDGVTTTEIARIGNVGPGGVGTFSDVGFLTKINSSGQVAFSGWIRKPETLSGVFRGDGSVNSVIALESQPAPALEGGTSGVYSAMSNTPVSINDAGQVAFTSQISGTPSGYTMGLFRGDGTNSTMILRSSLPAPNGAGGTTGSFITWERPVINASGAVAVVGRLQGTPGGGLDDTGFYVGDGTTLRQVARENDLAPDGNGRFQIFSSNSIFNDLGQMAFYAGHTGAAPGTSGGIYWHDPVEGLTTIARAGQPLLGSTIQTLMLAGSALDTPVGDQQTSGLNNLGQVAFQFRLTSGAEGVAIWSPPTSDFNDDGDVDGEDLAIWSDSYGDGSATRPEGDATGDGLIDGSDFLRWQREVTNLPQATAVPEPTAFSLGIAGFVLIAWRCWRSRS